MKGQRAQINRRNRSIGLFEVFPASNCILSSLNKGQWCFWRNLPFWKDPQSFQWISTKDALFTVVERAASFKLQASTKILASLCLFEILRLSASAGQLNMQENVEGKSTLTSIKVDLCEDLFLDVMKKRKVLLWRQINIVWYEKTKLFSK